MACASFVPTLARANLTAQYDDRCDAMIASPPAPDVLLETDAQPYFLAAVPRQLLLVHLCDIPGNLAADWLEAWHSYAAAWGYSVVKIQAVSSCGDDGLTSQPMAALAQQQLLAGHCQEAEDALRWALLAQHGGIAVDTSIWPPHVANTSIDFAAIMPLRGLVVLSGAKPHNTLRAPEVSGLAVSSSLVLASTNHPVVRALVATLAANYASVSAAAPAAGASYTTGSVLLTRMLTGSFTVLPYSFLSSFGVHHGP